MLENANNEVQSEMIILRAFITKALRITFTLHKVISPGCFTFTLLLHSLAFYLFVCGLWNLYGSFII